MNGLRMSIIGCAAALVVVSSADAQNPAAIQPPGGVPPAPLAPAELEVGRMAPDFTISVADSAGIKGSPVKLSDLRGKVVVLAFYPADRSSGCTFELTKFRDDYETLFGKETVVLPISVDSLSTHASWAAEMKFPFALGSDTDLAIAKQYGSTAPGRSSSTRTVFVIGKDGRIFWRSLRFTALNEGAYSELAEAVAKAH